MKRKMFKKLITTVIMMTMLLQSAFSNVVVFAADTPSDYDMGKAITDVSIQAWTGSEWYEIPQVLIEDGPEIERDAKIKVAISYEPSLLTESYKVNDTITYNLPNGIKATKEQSGDVYDGPTVVGRYKITTNGIIKITITNESYVEDSNGKLKNGKISFDGNLDENAWNEGGRQEIKFGDVTLEVKVKDKEVVTQETVNVVKTIEETVADKNNPNNAYIIYKIEVSTPANNTNNVKNVTVEDTFSAGADYISGIVVHTQPNKGSFNVNSKIWTVGDMKPGEKQVIYIKAKLNNKVFAAGSTVGDRTITNKAVVKANGTYKNDSEISEIFNSALNISKTNGSYKFDPTTGKAKLNYTVTVTAPSTNEWPITNVTVTDTFTDNKSYVIKYDNIQASGTTAKENNTAKSLEWTIGTMNPGDTKKLTYEVEINQTIFLNRGTSTGTSQVTRQANRTLINVATLYANKTPIKDVNSTETFKKVWIRKGGYLQTDGRIKFVVKGNEGNPMLNGKLTFTDKLSGNWVYDGNVSFVKYRINSDGSKTQVGNTETFNVDGKTNWEKEVEGGYYYEFTYYARYVGDKIGKPSISNTAGVGIGVGGTTYNHYATWQGTSNEFNALAKAFVHRNGKIASWRSEITTNIPAGSVYRDYRDSMSGREWTFTDQQIANVVVKKGNQVLVKGTDSKVADYKIERVDKSSFKITFLKAQSGITEDNPIVILYDTTLKTEDVAAGKDATYVNKAEITTPGGAKDTAQAQHTYLSELRMTKDGGYFNTETGELTWLITVNNTGSMKGEAVVADVLSPELKFVKAEITSRGSKAGSTKIAAIEAQDNRVVMNITGLNQTYDKKAYIVITLTTIIVDKAFLLGNGEKQFDNEASITYEGTMSTGYAIQTLKNDSLDKEGVYNENTAPNVEYTIRINPNGLNMLQDADTIRVEDTMSTNMMLKSDTLQIKDDDGNVIEPINLKVEGNVFSFNVPDNKALTVTYKAYVSGEVGSEVTISNKVSYYGMAEVPGKEIENKVKIEKSKASIEGAVGFYLVKKDAYDINKILPGTEFTLYELGKNTGKIGVANNRGIVSFVGLDENSIYSFKETKAADNYLIGDNSELTYVAFKKDVVEKAKLPEGVKVEDVQIIQSGIALERYNEYNTNTTIRFSGVKTLENANYDLSANEYEFKLTGPNLVDANGKSVKSVVVGHDKDGKIAFPSIRYELKELADAGSKDYEYTINEVTGTKAGIKYSKDEYKVTVTVSKNEENGLITAKITKVTKNGNVVNTQSFDYVNTYEADDITTTVSGVKKTEGIALKEGAFEFTLVETTVGVNKPYTKTVKNDEKGKFTFELPKYTVKDHGKTFTYEIYEVNKGQDGMTYDESVYTFTVKITDNKKGKLQLEKTLTLGDKVVDVATFTNYFAGSVELIKTNGETGDNYDTLENAEFTLYDSRGYAIETYTTNEDGYLKVEGLAEGSYYFIETKAPAGYEAELDEDGTTKHYPFTIGLNGTTEVVRAKITVSNDRKLGSVSLVKNETDTDNVLADAIFDLYKDGEIYKEGLATNAEGKIELSELPWGEYYFVETKAPAGFSIELDETGEAKQYPFVIGVENETEILSADITVSNDKKLGSVSLIKNETNTDNVLADAIFDLYKDGEIYKEGLTTNAEGKIEVSELPWGEYYFVETKAPAGYEIQLDEDGEAKQYPFVIGAEGDTETISVFITVSNDKKLGSVSLVKNETDTDNVLENAIFDLYKDGEIYEEGLVTDSEGKIEVTELPWGEYYFVETKAPAGFAIQLDENGEAKQYPFVIGVEGETEILSANITVDNDRKLGSVMLIKNETDTSNLLANAVFDLYKDGEIYEEGLVTNKDGYIEVLELPWGEYYFVEIQAPAGYEILVDEEGNPKHYEFVIGVEGETEILSADITVDNDRKLGSVSLIKNETDTDNVLADAIFDLYKDGEIYEEGLVTDSEGKIEVTELPWGEYYFVETKAPAGFSIELDETGEAKQYPFVIGVEGKTEILSADINVENDRKLGSVSLVKNETDTDNVLANAIFDLYKDGEIYKEGLTTDENGKIEVSELPWGEYYFVETKAPAGYEILVDEEGNPKHYEFVIGIEGETEILSADINVSNDRKLGSVSLVKNETNTDNVLANAIFDLYKDGEIYKEGLVSDENGKIEVSELPWGEYYFVETKAPAGYEILVDEEGNPKHYEFVIGVEGETEILSADINVSNDRKLGSLSLIKKDAVNKDVLANVVFDLYKDGEIYKEGLVTDENGKVEVTKLPWGEYYFVETATIEGYLLDTTATDVVVIDATYVEGKPLTVEKLNVPTIVSFSKVDIADAKEVAGAFLEIYEVSEDEELELVTSWLSDGSVHEIYATLAAGKTYVLKETIAPQGYGYIHADIYFTVNEDGSVTTEATLAEDENGNAVIMVEDEAIHLEVNKVDSHTKQKLEGAVFAIYDGETAEEIISWTSEKETNYNLGAQLIADRKYILKEVQSPEGYRTIGDVEFVVDREGKVELVTESTHVTCVDGYMEIGNDRIPVDTSDTSNVGMYYILMLFSMFGIIVLPRRRKE